MPSLHIFGRRWTIASDDFVFPSITEASVRFLWFIVALSIYVTHAKIESCSKLHAFMIAALILNALVIILSLSTAYVSSLGTILNSTPRRRVSLLIYLRLPLILAEFVLNIIGSVWVNDKWSVCDAAFIGGVTVTVIGGWFVILLMLIGIYMTFDPLGKVHHADYRLNDEAKKLWKRRIRTACFCASRSDKAKIAFEDVAELISDLFGDSDLVWTDVWAAILLLANKELRVLNERCRTSTNDEIPPWMNVQLASRMIDFSLGIYGWPYYVCGRGCSLKSAVELYGKLRCCSGCRCDNVIVIKDNCCLCNTAALILQTGIRETDLFYVNLHNEVWETPFIACFDHSSRAIVIAIRGSLSLRDAITDLSACEDSLQVNTCPATSNSVHNGNENSNSNCVNMRVHKGMLSSARYVLSKIESEKILDDMFVLQPNYDLVITGHSLGAGVAAVASVLLKSSYPNVKCFAFSPPGCVISDDSVEFTRSFVFSVVIGDDLVPRLSMNSMKALKQNVIDVLHNYDRPKFEILLKGCFKMLCGGRRNPPVGRAASVLVDDEGDEDIERNGTDRVARVQSGSIITSANDNEPLITGRGRVTSYTDERRSTSSESACVNLKCPGRILHLVPTVAGDWHAYTSRWVHCNQFSDIVMSSSMVMDHMPWTVSQVLKNNLTVQL